MTPKRSIPSSEGFGEIFKKPDQKFSTKNILVLSRSNNCGVSRIGVAIRKKDFRLAVKRNSIKRKIKGSFNSKVLELPSKDYVVLVKKSLKGKEEKLHKDLETVWQKFINKND
tara:strand:+ start:140 stop:478 length:339 start_codon:yes stop_codon:yes gene_type:complete